MIPLKEHQDGISTGGTAYGPGLQPTVHVNINKVYSHIKSHYVIIFLSVIPSIEESETNIDAGSCSHDHKCSAVTVGAFHKPATKISAGWAETI